MLGPLEAGVAVDDPARISRREAAAGRRSALGVPEPPEDEDPPDGGPLLRRRASQFSQSTRIDAALKIDE